MSPLQILFSISMMGWFLSELLYKNMLKSTQEDQKNKDQYSLHILWVAILFSIASSVMISNKTNFPITSGNWIFYVGVALILIGIIFRFVIIRSLGKYFTVDVTIKQDHRVKKEGFYKYLRHPSYAFSLLTSLGLGLYLNNWFSLILAFLPPFLGFAYRIKIEERVLLDQFGDEYIEYRKKTKKLIPFIY